MTRRKPRRVVVESRVDREARLAQQGADARPEKRAPLRSSRVLMPESESDAAWGDEPDSNDARLLENLPPHWGRG
ncbi:MAG: transcriptional regulator [Bowdeniella nasicola]|nr:transcriptional regulator [Bowdeniella nasicola]